MCCNDNIYRPIFNIVNIGLFNIIHLKCILFATMILYISNTIIMYIVLTMIHLLYGFFMMCFCDKVSDRGDKVTFN